MFKQPRSRIQAAGQNRSASLNGWEDRLKKDDGFGKSGFMPTARHGDARAGIEARRIVEGLGKLAWVRQQALIVRAGDRQVIMSKPNASVRHARGDAGPAQRDRQAVRGQVGVGAALHPRQQSGHARPKGSLFAGLGTMGIDGIEASRRQSRHKPKGFELKAMGRAKRFAPCGAVGADEAAPLAAQAPKRLVSDKLRELVALFIQRGVLKWL